MLVPAAHKLVVGLMYTGKITRRNSQYLRQPHVGYAQIGAWQWEYACGKLSHQDQLFVHEILLRVVGLVGFCGFHLARLEA